jgi:hypothetical protein
MATQEITLKVNTDEANLVLEALGNLPFVRVYALIGRLQQQAAAQFAKESAAQETPLAEPPAAVEPDE